MSFVCNVCVFHVLFNFDFPMARFQRKNLDKLHFFSKDNLHSSFFPLHMHKITCVLDVVLRLIRFIAFDAFAIIVVVIGVIITVIVAFATFLLFFLCKFRILYPPKPSTDSLE